MKHIYIILLFNILFSPLEAAPEYWKKVNAHQLSVAKTKLNYIKSYQIYAMDHLGFNNFVQFNVPLQAINEAPVEIQIPMPDGSIAAFKCFESPMMEPELMEKFPDIRSYVGSNDKATIRFTISDNSFYGIIFTGEEEILVETLNPFDTKYIISYKASEIDLSSIPTALKCGTGDVLDKPMMSGMTKGELQRNNTDFRASLAGGEPVKLRTYRTAIACTGEWGRDLSRGGGTVENAIRKIVESLTYINGVLEKDVALHLSLIADNDKIIFLEPSQDPYSAPTSGGSTLGQNTAIVTQRVGVNKYDFGHVFTGNCTDVGGIASLGSICSNDRKAAGVTCWYTPDVAYVNLRIVCHEMGHQLDGRHTFMNCNGNEDSSSSVEPGSGSTIMSYAGLCGDQNVISGGAPHPNYYHSWSVNQILNFAHKTGEGTGCGTVTEPGNTAPVAQHNYKDGFYIPISTPFELVGSATDMENDNLTFGWEQIDVGFPGDNLGEPMLNNPMFRSLFPGPSPVRTFPNWNTILNDITGLPYTRDEVLPSTSRDLSFRFIVRDNHPGVGGVHWNDVYLKSTDQAGPFRVVFPNSTGDKLVKNSCIKIVWDVANTNKAPVNCQKVDIYLVNNKNINGAIKLASNTENDGVEAVDIPDITTTNAKILIKAADNVFFDISDRNITIAESQTPALSFTLKPYVQTLCLPAKIDVDFRTCAVGGFTGVTKVEIVSGLPPNTITRFSKTDLTNSDQGTVNLDFSDVIQAGIYDIVFKATLPNGQELTETFKLDLIRNDFSDLVFLTPADGASGLTKFPTFYWTKSNDADYYTFELSSHANFDQSNILVRETNYTIDSVRVTVNANPNTIYFWRVIPHNRCGQGAIQKPNVFQTIARTCKSFVLPINSLVVPANATTTAKLNVNSPGTVTDANIGRVAGSFDLLGQTKISLQGPSGKNIVVMNRRCNNILDLDAKFDDEAQLAIKCPPNNGIILRPEGKLATFIGDTIRGGWSLIIEMDRVARNSVLTNFEMEFCSDVSLSPPSLIINDTLRLAENTKSVITKSLLEVNDIDNSPAELSYIVSSLPSHGILTKNGIPVPLGEGFTQEEINNGVIEYMHSGLKKMHDGFDFIVKDPTGGWIGQYHFNIKIAIEVSNKDLPKIEFLVYPNPNDGNFIVQLTQTDNSNGKIDLIQADGKIVYEVLMEDNSYRYPISVSGLKSGVNYLRIISNSGIGVKKVYIK